MKIPKFKPPGKSEHDKSYLSILVLMLAVFMLALIGIVSQGATVHASVVTPDLSAYTYSTEWDYVYSTNENGLPCIDFSTTIVSKYPIYGYLSGGIWRMALVDFETQEYFELTSANSDDYVNTLYYIRSCLKRSTSKDNKSNTLIDFTGGSYQLLKSEFSTAGYASCVYIQTGTYGAVRKCTATVFESEDALKAFIQTGELVGVIHEGDATIDGRDFSGEYDPDVPVPQLKSLSYNGFTVANAADNLELDLVVETYYYGYKLTGSSMSTVDFIRDDSWLYNSTSFDCTANSEIGYTKSTYNLLEDFGVNNVLTLANYGHGFFTEYPRVKNLPNYSFWTHGALNDQYDGIALGFALEFTDEDFEYAKTCLNRCGQAVTKYYVRFYELRETDTGMQMVPGQWYSYKYSVDKKGKQSTIVSPVGGDEDGKPVDEDPQEGEQDEDGNIVINPPINYSGDSLLEIITGILGDLTEMIAAFQDFASFLTEGLSFIPENIWTLIRIGFGLSVCFLVWRFVVK